MDLDSELAEVRVGGIMAPDASQHSGCQVWWDVPLTEGLCPPCPAELVRRDMQRRPGEVMLTQTRCALARQARLFEDVAFCYRFHAKEFLHRHQTAICQLISEHRVVADRTATQRRLAGPQCCAERLHAGVVPLLAWRNSWTTLSRPAVQRVVRCLPAA